MQALERISREDLQQAERFYRTTFVNALSGFKSLCLCGTASEDGKTNLCPLFSVIHVGANPPYLGLLFRPHTTPRHTLENILSTKHFTLNHVQESFYQAAHQTAARYPREASEFAATGLHPEFSEILHAPYVAEANVRIGLAYREHHELLNGTLFVVGEILEAFYPGDCLGPDGYLDLHKAGSITVAGLDAYHSVQPIARMAYAKPEQPPRTLD